MSLSIQSLVGGSLKNRKLLHKIEEERTLKNRAKELFRNGEVVLGITSMSGSEAIVVILDREHGPMSVETIARLVRASEATGLTPLVRVAHNDETEIRRCLDVGAMGIVVPHIDTAKELINAVGWSKYPPYGSRGCALGVRASRYGSTNWDTYVQEAAKECMVIPLIESMEGVQALEEIVRIDGVDVIYLGTFDLAQSLGLSGKGFDSPELQDILMKTLALCNAHRKSVMVTTTPHGTVEYARWLVDRGVRGISFGGDLMLFAQVCKHIVTIKPH
jgi:4-hydroxy-2-oxoheptanedioate aldolase